MFMTMYKNPTDPMVKFSRSSRFGESKFEWYFCDAYVSESSKHWKSWNRWVLNFDHHWIWLNNWVGKYNYKYFFITVL